MAHAAGMKRFYAALIAIAVVGGGWIWMSTQRAGAVLPAEPLSESDIAAASAFPGYLLGSETAPVEVTEFADFQCPGCRQFAILTMYDVKQRLVSAGRVRWRFKDFPLEMHPNSRPAHHAAACADEQGRFWEMHDQLFDKQAEWSYERNPGRRFTEYARGIGLDLTRFEECTRAGRYRARIEASVRDGIKLGITSTPSFIAGRMRLAEVPSYDRLRALIDSLATPPTR